MWSQGSTLIVDDKREDGQPISDQLDKFCVPHLFFHADLNNVTKIKKLNPAPLNKVRLVFQDICLISSSSPTTTDFDIAVDILDKLLSDDNGPWLMITWSTWSGVDDTYARALFEHLRTELHPNKRPYSFNVFDKSQFVPGNDHGTVIPFDDLGEEKQQSFSHQIQEAAAATPAMSALMSWEKAVGNAVSNTLADLHSLSDHQADHDSRVGRLLFELSNAEAGKSLRPDNSWPALMRILNSQLLDRVGEYRVRPLAIDKYKDEATCDDVEEWKRRINRILHFELSYAHDGPGSIYKFDSYIRALLSGYIPFKKRQYRKSRFMSRIPASRNNIEPIGAANESSNLLILSIDHVKNSFLSILNHTDLSNDPAAINCLENAEYVIVDITPPCDHAQNKADMKKFCAGALIDYPVFNGGSAKANKGRTNLFKKTFLESDYLWSSCSFSIESEPEITSHKKLIINSRLIFSIPDNEYALKLLKTASVPKMREQISRDLTHWLGRQLSRPGYTSM